MADGDAFAARGAGRDRGGGGAVNATKQGRQSFTSSDLAEDRTRSMPCGGFPRVCGPAFLLRDDDDEEDQEEGDVGVAAAAASPYIAWRRGSEKRLG